MKLQVYIASICMAILPLLTFCQQPIIKRDHTFVDSIAKQVSFHDNVDVLTQTLIAPCSDDYSKARVIFRWITENIGYDYKLYNRMEAGEANESRFSYKSGEDYLEKERAWENKYIHKVLRKKKAICGGYAMLFKKMCDLAGLRSEVVTGDARTKYYEVGTAGSLHAWNAIWLDSSWQLLDATWAAGGCWENDEGVLKGFTKNFNNYYWLTPAKDLGRNHYPKKPEWVLQENFTKEKFVANPYYEYSIIPQLQLLYPNTGIIAVKKGDTIHFKIKYTGGLNKLQINSNTYFNPPVWTTEKVRGKTIRTMDTLAIKKQRYITFTRQEDIIEFDYPVTDQSLYYLDLLFDTKRVMRFKVNVRERTETSESPSVGN